MNLVIDIGNTKTKFGLFKNNSLINESIFFNHEKNKMDSFLSRQEFESSLLSSTAVNNSYLIDQLRQKSYFIELNQTLSLPITINYESRATLGDDRIAAVCGARAFEPNNPILAITAGTCITYNCLTANNQFIGGGISPGIFMRYQAMNEFTEQLPLVQNDEYDELVGTSTKKSLQSGVRKGITAEVDGIIEEYKLLYPKIKVFISGGDTSFFESRLKNRIFAHSNLVLHGLNQLLIHNQKD